MDQQKITNVTTPREVIEAGQRLMQEKATNPYEPPKEMIDTSQIDPLFRRLMFAIWPKVKCRERGHDWEYDHWSWKRVCRNCGKFEAYRS